MFVLHIDLPIKPNSDTELERVFAKDFQPAISAQDGFRGTELMRCVEDDSLYCLTIAFDQQASQQRWIATELHDRVWSAMTDLCTGFEVRKYNTVT